MLKLSYLRWQNGVSFQELEGVDFDLKFTYCIMYTFCLFSLYSPLPLPPLSLSLPLPLSPPLSLPIYPWTWLSASLSVHLSPSFYTFLRFPPCGYFIHICILFPYLYTNSLLFPSPPPLHLSSLPHSRSHWAFLLWFIIPPVSCLRRKVGPVICRMKTTTNCTQFVYCSVDIKTIGRCELYARELKNYGGWGGGGSHSLVGGGSCSSCLV